MERLFLAIEGFLFIIAQALLYPVLLGLLFLVAYLLYQCGKFLRELRERLRDPEFYLSSFRERLSELKRRELSFEEMRLEMERLLEEEELRLLKSFDQVRFGVRVGPALGLIGTLVPMGVALAELAKGNLPSMAGRMVTAFTTAIVGLACGVGFYLLSLVKERWMRESMGKLTYLCEKELQAMKDMEHKL